MNGLTRHGRKKRKLTQKQTKLTLSALQLQLLLLPAALQRSFQQSNTDTHTSCYREFS